MTDSIQPERGPGQFSRYVVNGLAATAIHYGTLSFCIEVLRFPSAGLANLVAACLGITASFFGSRHFVFRRPDEAIGPQAVRFGTLYAGIAVLHAIVLALWTDWLGLDYRWGFVLATGLQVAVSYWGNKRLVFHRPAAERQA